MTNPNPIAHPEVVVDLSGKDGNVFNIIGAVTIALRRAGLPVEAKAFAAACFNAASYDEVLQLALSTVTVN